MTFSMYTEPVNGVSDVTLIRHSKHKIEITTAEKPLDDDQMRDLYWIVLLMLKTGKTMKDMLRDLEPKA